MAYADGTIFRSVTNGKRVTDPSPLLQVYATYPYNTNWPSLSLVNNAIIANGPYDARTYALGVDEGNFVEFEDPDKEAPAAVYCGVVSLWSLSY